MRKARLLRLIPVAVLGLIIGIFTLLTSAGLLAYLLDDSLTFVNDTDGRIEFMVFFHDNYDLENGKVSRVYALEPGDEKRIRDSYPACVHLNNSGESFLLEMEIGADEQTLNLLEIMNSGACPLELDEWNAGDRWKCVVKKSGVLPCQPIK